MLSHFFKLDDPYRKFDEAALIAHFAVSKDIRGILYQPDQWPPEIYRLNGVKFFNVSLAKTKFKEITFTECEFEDCLFIGSTFDHVEFHRCKFKNCNFYKTEINDCYLDPRTIFFDSAYRASAPNVGIHLFQELFQDASKARQSTFAMHADIELRRWMRWQLPYDEKIGKIGPFERKASAAYSFLYEMFAGFGYRPVRFLVTTLAFFLFVSWVNYLLLSGSLKHGNDIISDMGFFDSIFYTFSMLTVLGFSFITPHSDFAKILTVLEALCGVGWLAIFTSIIVKRVIK